MLTGLRVHGVPLRVCIKPIVYEELETAGRIHEETHETSKSL